MFNTRFLSEGEVRELFELNYSKLICFASKFVEKPIAEDILQDIFYQLLMKCGKITISISIEAYVYKAIKNKYLDHLKGRAVHDRFVERSTKLVKDEFLYFEENNIKSLVGNTKEEQVLIAIDTLPSKCREIMVAKYLEGKKNGQISLEMGISQRTVETHAYNALKILRATLRNTGSFISFVILSINLLS